jgi:argininosuccinate lyase
MKLWGGRFAGKTDPAAERLNASLGFDIRLAAEDVDGNCAWAKALAGAGIVSPDELRQLLSGLDRIRSEFSEARFASLPSDEDIHTAVERRLTEVVGEPAGTLHTGRSRNDQVATDLRLWVMRACGRIDGEITGLQRALLQSAAGALDVPMPGYTHLQPAQPVTWGQWALSHFWPLARDRARFVSTRGGAAVLPLGSGALAGAAFPIDRRALAAELGFAEISPNSIDGVADRDFAAEFLFAAALLGVHLSRLSEQVILYSSREFGFVEIDDAYATGSSLMPHKKNPDPLELARGKAGRLIGSLVSLLATLKGLPSAYDKDLQEDKEPVFDAYDTLMLLLPVLAGLIATLRLHPERMLAAIEPGMLAVDLADYLVERGLAFRQAHEVVGRAMALSERRGVSLSALPLEDLRALSPLFAEDMLEVFDVRRALARRTVPGGVGPEALRRQLEAAEASLGQAD